MKKHIFTALMALAATSYAAGTPAGTQITNTAYLDTLTSNDPAATPVSTPSNPVTVTVVHVPAIAITPDSPGTPTNPVVPTDPANPAQCGQSVIGIPGRDAVLTYSLSNPSNGTDTYDLSTNAVTGTTAGNVTYYQDSNGNGVYDAGSDVAVTKLTLDADKSATFFAVYPVPSGSLATQGYALTPVGTSETDGTVLDGNNYGCITTQKVYSINLTTDNKDTAQTPDTKTYTHTLTNTGNVELTGSDIAASQTNDQPTFTTTVHVGNQTQEYPSLSDALNAYGPLAPGASIPVTVTLNVPAGITGGSVNTLTWSVHTKQIPDADAQNLTPNDITVSDITTVLQGSAKVEKSVMSCGTDANCAAPVAVNNNEVKPGEYIQYTVAANNAGQGNLWGAKVRDPLPANLTPTAISAAITGASGGQLLYSTNGTTWQTTPTVPAAQGSVYVAYDSNNDGTITFADILPASAQITVKVTAKVN